ncbi:hypothetical protein SCLCIDRAFT_24410 [Scleroderma citrinum Foug A]|uniref:Uncharacterized protein n=1 Tax=Scleroderma citrinum Foug A TaxID=1036808 RepID=A0A0C3E491_9AGAM|nr:hypothetical protein SCLCIDRAFT_24410 [Scleroderma citrinum Foug A]
MAKPTDADVDLEKTPLGRDPAERACRVDEGKGTEREPQLRLQETKLLCRDIDQRSRNTNETVPIANGLLLKGEWIVCASGEIGCERSMDGRACIDKAEEADQVPTECCQQLGMADGDPSRDIEPADIPNELEELVPVSIKLESLDSGGIPCIHLGGTRCRVGNANRPGNGADASYCETDVSKGQVDVVELSILSLPFPTLTGSFSICAPSILIRITEFASELVPCEPQLTKDVSRAQTDASNVSDRAKTDVTGHRENASTYLSAGDARCSEDEMDGIGSHTDVPSQHGDVLSVEMNVILPTNTPENVSIPQKRTKPPDLPVEVAICTPAESDGLGDQTDMLTTHTDAHSIETAMETAANETQNIRNLQLNGADEAIAPNVGKRAGDGSGDQDGDDGGDGNVDGMTSGDTVDSTQVEGMRLAERSQHMRQSRRT